MSSRHQFVGSNRFAASPCWGRPLAGKSGSEYATLGVVTLGQAAVEDTNNQDYECLATGDVTQILTQMRTLLGNIPRLT